MVEVEKKNILREISIDDTISCIAWQQDKMNSNQPTEPTEDNLDKTNMVLLAKFLSYI